MNNRGAQMAELTFRCDGMGSELGRWRCGSPYLSVLTVLGGLQLVWRLHKVERVSREPRDYVAELEAKHHQPALHICSGQEGN